MNQIQKILNDDERDLLNIILERSINNMENLEVTKFRMEFIKKRETLDNLESTQLVKKTKDGTKYKLSLVGIYLINSESSKKVFKDIDNICDVLRDHYKLYFSTPIKIDVINNTLELDKKYLVFCLNILCQGSTMGRTIDMMSEDADITPNEQLFDFELYAELPEQHLPLWFPNKFKNKKPGNTEANASNREEILGAAVAVIANYPKECSWGGSIVGKRVYKQIYEKSLIWWDDGEVPLGNETSIELINKWLKTIK